MGEAALLVCLLRNRGAGFAIGAPPIAVSNGVHIGAQPLALGVFGSHGGSAGLAPGSGTQHDSRVRVGVREVRGFLLSVWCAREVYCLSTLIRMNLYKVCCLSALPRVSIWSELLP